MLRVESLSVHYGKIHALKSVSLDLEEGEIVCLIGANGAGKSTTLMAISRVLKPSGGSVAFEGRDLAAMEAEEVVQAGIAQVPEGRRVFPALSVQENLRMGAFSRKDRGSYREDVDRVYDLFPRLKERQKQKAGTLSGGEQQMLAIGRSLMSRPRLLLLDEPSLGLSPIMVDRVFETISEINRQGTSVLLVEQNAFAALNLANRGYVLETGRTILTGSGKDLLANREVQQAYLG